MWLHLVSACFGAFCLQNAYKRPTHQLRPSRLACCAYSRIITMRCKSAHRSLELGGEHVPSFDFVSDNEFRAILDSDYGEMRSALENTNYKTVHVLAGSVVEALLVDYLTLLSENDTSLNPQQILKWSLGELVDAALTRGAISQQVHDLSSVVRDYRNLIHPGRVVRLGQKVSQDSADIAAAVTHMVISAIGDARKDSLGMTAQQVLTKIETDPSVMPILGRLLRGLSTTELNTLLLDALPTEFLKGAYAGPDHKDWGDADQERAVFERTQAYLEECYHQAFREANEQTQRSAMLNLVEIVKMESVYTVHPYEDAFLRGPYLGLLEDADRLLLVEHLLGRAESQTPPKPAVFMGMAPYLSGSSFHGKLWGLVDRAVRAKDLYDSTSVDILCNLYWDYDPDVMKMMDDRVDQVAEHYSKWDPQKQERARELVELLHTEGVS